MNASGLGALMGGIGLFLLGMLLMTEGLKTAAGPTLSRLLSTSTATRWRALASGIFVTALVQSSSAVTVAAIGFVNAGLLTFGQSLWLLFGSNVGTTMTGWLVALIGLKIKVEAAALPMIGIGMALHLSGANRRRGAVGSALAGFGVLFLGIGFLQASFSDVGRDFDLAALGGQGWLSVPAFVLAGLLLTVLMQSSSASLAIVLTLAQTGVLPLSEAAAAVIGANIGTTVTAMLAAIGATSNARRAAAAHVLFNILTGTVALLLLPLLIDAVDLIRSVFALDSSPAVSLALFHTVFNVLGVVLMWPLANRLALFLQRRFRTREEEIGQPRYLDTNVASIPSLAADALRREITRVGGYAVGSAWAQAGGYHGQAQRPNEGFAVAQLGKAVAGFVARLNREPMSAASADTIATLLRAQRYYDTCAELSPEIAIAPEAIEALNGLALHDEVIDLIEHSEELLLQINPDTEPFAPASAEQHRQFEDAYQRIKAGLLAAGARGELDIHAMDSVMRSLSALRRVIDQAAKAAHLLYNLSRSRQDAAPTAEDEVQP